MSAEPETTNLADTLPENISAETSDSASQNFADPDVQLWSPPKDLTSEESVMAAGVDEQLWEPTEAEIVK